MLEMAANASLNREMEEIAGLNEMIARGDSPYWQRGPIRLHIIRPDHPLPLDPDLYLGLVSADTLIRRGFADAQRYIATSTPDGSPLSPETLIMTAAAPGITFGETMEGPFSLGATEPKPGAAQGEKAGTALAIHVTVTVRDMDRFIADPQHNGTLIGHIDFPPLGKGIPTGEGVFRLFSPAEDPRTRLMVYELPFRHQGESYYLAGYKEVRDDPGFDVWTDTTTLYTRLYRSADVSGPIVGAGVLRLDAATFAKVAASVRAVDAESGTEAATLIAKFGSFFARELWMNYAPAPHA